MEKTIKVILFIPIITLFILIFFFALKSPKMEEQAKVSDKCGKTRHSIRGSLDTGIYPESFEVNVLEPQNTEPNYQSESPDEISTLNEREEIVAAIDIRVSFVDKSIGVEFYQDHYDGDTLIYEYKNCEIDFESFIFYRLYYDEDGTLVYAHIIHYRGPNYSIYFYDNELFYVAVGPFRRGQISVNGDLAHVMDIVSEEEYYSFILDDRARCLEYAKK